MPMPKPHSGESRADFVSRFMKDMTGEFPDEKQRAAVAYKEWGERRENGDKGRVVRMKVIEPGLVNYEDVGTVLLRRNGLEAFAASFIGVPIFNEQHKPSKEGDFRSGRADGIVTGVEWGGDGWLYMNAMVWDDTIAENAARGYGVSCAYDVMKWSDGGGIHNNIPYVREILDGRADHVAVVPKGRYEDATLYVMNSIEGGGTLMELTFWPFGKKGDKPEKVKLENATVCVGEDKKVVPLADLMKAYNEAEKEKAEKEEPKAENALKEDDEVEMENSVGAKVKVKVKDLMAAYNAKNSKPAAPAAPPAPAAAPAPAPAKIENAAPALPTPAPAPDPKAAALDAAATARNNTAARPPVFMSRREQAAEGAKRYGQQPGQQAPADAK